MLRSKIQGTYDGQIELPRTEPEEDWTPESLSTSGTKTSATALAFCVMDYCLAEASPEENTLKYQEVLGRPFHFLVKPALPSRKQQAEAADMQLYVP